MGSSAQSSSGVHWCRRRVRFNEVPEKVPKVSEGSREGLGGRSQVQQGSGEGPGEGSGEGSEKVSEKVVEALVQSQVRFSRVPQNIPEKVPGSRGAKPSQVQRVRGKVGETNAGEVHLTHGNLAEEFPALGFPARFKKIDKNKTLRLLGIPPKVFLGQFAPKNGPGLQKLLSVNRTW